MAELALVVCILLVIVIGIVDFGRAIQYWNDENHLANEAARYAATGVLPTSGPCGGSADLTAYIQCEAKQDSTTLASGSSSSNGPQGPLGICISVPSAAVGQPVTVKISATYKWLPLPSLAGAINLGSSTINGTATMRLEQTAGASWATTTGSC
jgi:Flp pilus assembly protein TadG